MAVTLAETSPVTAPPRPPLRCFAGPLPWQNGALAFDFFSTRSAGTLATLAPLTHSHSRKQTNEQVLLAGPPARPLAGRNAKRKVSGEYSKFYFGGRGARKRETVTWS